jgi:outer membrane protein assembly factor BamB
MTLPHKSTTPASRKPLRLWPGVVLAVVLILARYVIPVIASDVEIFSLPLSLLSVFAGMLCAFAILLWWLFLSRAPWPERLGAIVLMILAIMVTHRIVDESIAGGMMGMMLFMYSVPLLSLTLVGWAVATRHAAVTVRRASLVAAILLACAPWTIVRTAGLIGGGSEFHWRWTETPEERLLAQPVETPKPQDDIAVVDEKPGVTIAPAEAAPAPKVDTSVREETPRPAEWPGFRGPNRDSGVRGVRINTDWSTAPPVEVWRRTIGPGWSSFAVRGDILYTQEQRGEEELVTAYKVSTGEPVWRHRDAVRFWESNGGAGPRATPTIDGNRLFAFGATGILNALDAREGTLLWQRNVAADTSRDVPDWGFSSSPLVIDGTVIVAAAATLAAYDVATGNLRWRGPSVGGSYSSPHRATFDGDVQVLLLGGPGAISVDPSTGKTLWQHAWAPGAIVQPAQISNRDILVNAIAATGGLGLRRLSIDRGADGWSVAELWTSNGLKPYFNDFVVHNDHAFGFDGNILACIDLADGKRKWKGGRYGNGQLVLLRDQDLLLVLSEDGELVLVGAKTDQFREIARAPALEGKTWNHPALVGDVLLVRNGQEMAAFRLPLTHR